MEDGQYIILINTHIQVFCYLEEACNSCSTTLVTMHSSHDTTSLDVSTPCVVGDTLQATKHTSSSLQSKYTKWVTVTPVQVCSPDTQNVRITPVQVWLDQFISAVQIHKMSHRFHQFKSAVQIHKMGYWLHQFISAVQILKMSHRFHQFKSAVQMHEKGHKLYHFKSAVQIHTNCHRLHQFYNQWWVSSLKTLQFLSAAVWRMEAPT